MSNFKQSSIRPVGQRSITTTLPFRASNQQIDCNTDLEIKLSTKNGSNLLLSEFLNRKLDKSPALPKSVTGKKVAFSLPLANEEFNKVAEGELRGQNGGDAKKTLSLDGVFQMFKNVKKNEKELAESDSCDKVGSFGLTDLHQLGKRKKLFEGVDHKPSNIKRLAVLGEDLKPTRRSKRKEELKPFFNHYKSGGGWWDENMEGLDNEAVGCKDTWEGVGRTTLGAL